MSDPIRVLLVEDDIIDQKAFARAGLPYQVAIAKSTAEARALLQHDRFDVILADYRLGDGIALEFLQSSTPMIVITGVGDEEIAVRALKAGAYDYLVKDHDRRYLSMLPMIIDSVLRRRQLELDEREQRALASALHDSALTLTSTLDLEEVLQRILLNVQKVVPHDSANIMLIEGEIARIVQSPRMQPRTEIALRIPEVEHLQEMVQTHQPCLVPDVSRLASWVSITGLEAVAAYLAAPLIVNNQVMGFINLDSRTVNHFTAAHGERLQAFAAQAAIALENARLYRESQALAALEERQQIARDLHDSVTQTLFSAAMMTDSVITLWQRDPAAIGAELHELRDLTRGALAEMRALLLELRPNALLETSLNDLLLQLVETVTGRSRIHAQLDLPGEMVLPPDVKVAFFRIAQEALNNVIKHARARQVTLTLSGDGHQARLSVKDDGRGFDLEHISAGRLGLKIMHERAQAVAVQLTISSVLGSGTEVCAEWTRG